jgi:nitrate reductase gamma subunit
VGGDEVATGRSSHMSIGTGIFLFVVGAILAFAINVQVEWANLDLIGYILMGAGAVIFLIGIILFLIRRSQNGAVDTQERI